MARIPSPAACRYWNPLWRVYVDAYVVFHTSTTSSWVSAGAGGGSETPSLDSTAATAGRTRSSRKLSQLPFESHTSRCFKP